MKTGIETGIVDILRKWIEEVELESVETEEVETEEVEAEEVEMEAFSSSESVLRYRMTSDG